jgi:hypothetical protein
MTEKLKKSAVIPAKPMAVFKAGFSSKGHAEMTGLLGSKY